MASSAAALQYLAHGLAVIVDAIDQHQIARLNTKSRRKLLGADLMASTAVLWPKNSVI